MHIHAQNMTMDYQKSMAYIYKLFSWDVGMKRHDIAACMFMPKCTVTDYQKQTDYLGFVYFYRILTNIYQHKWLQSYFTKKLH